MEVENFLDQKFLSKCDMSIDTDRIDIADML